MFKKELIEKINASLLLKVNELSSDIQSLIESRNNDTKSSAGDKYETSREMAQLELNKLESQLSKTKILLNELKKASNLKKYTQVEAGSLVYTNTNIYFISIPFGKIICNGIEVFVISSASPLGSALLHKKIGDGFTFQSNNIDILNIE